MTKDNSLSDMELTNLSFHKNTIQGQSTKNYNSISSNETKFNTLTPADANIIYNVSDSSLNLPPESPYIALPKRSLNTSSESMIMSSLHLTDNTTPSNKKSSNTMSPLRLSRTSNKNQANKSFESEENSELIKSNQLSQLIETILTDDEDSEILERSAVPEQNRYRNVSERKKKRNVNPDEQENSCSPKKRRRKLYNPDQILIEINVDDNIERENRWRKRQPKSVTIIRAVPLNHKIISNNNVEIRRSKRNSQQRLNDSEEFEYNQDLASLKDHLRQIELLKQSIQPRGKQKTSTPLCKKTKKTQLSNKNICRRRSNCCQKVEDNKNKQKSLSKGKENKKKKRNNQDDALIIQRRTSARLSDSSNGLKELVQNKSQDSQINIKSAEKRRSSFYFDLVAQTSKKSKALSKPKKLPAGIVCTKLHRSDVQFFAETVAKLGRFVVENNVSSKTTHLVAGEPKRTINMLRAITRGCWVVKFEWVLQSLKTGKWLPEERFEVTEFSSTVQQARLERRAFGPQFTLDVFQNCGPIYVAPDTSPSRSQLEELISLCKGKLVKSLRLAKIVVGKINLTNRLFVEMPKHVNELWVLDSITHNKKMPFNSCYFYG